MTSKKLINGDTYRKLSDQKLAQILISDTCSFNNSSHIPGSQAQVLEDLKARTSMFLNNKKGLYIRKSNSQKHDAWASICLRFLKEMFRLSNVAIDPSNRVGQQCKSRMSKHYIFKHIEMVHIIESPKNPILYSWIGNIAAISKPNKAYTDTGSNGFGREEARKLWQRDQFMHIQDSISLYNSFIESQDFPGKILSWTSSNQIPSAYVQKLLATFSKIEL